MIWLKHTEAPKHRFVRVPSFGSLGLPGSERLSGRPPRLTAGGGAEPFGEREGSVESAILRETTKLTDLSPVNRCRLRASTTGESFLVMTVGGFEIGM